MLSILAGVAHSFWTDKPAGVVERSGAPLLAKAAKSRDLLADTAALRSLLTADSVDLELPLPDGQTAIYHLEYSPIAEQGLIDKYPEIRTFRGTHVDNPDNRGRFDISPAGFRGMFRHEGRMVFIDPKYRDSTSTYLAYYASDAQPLSVRPADTLRYTDLLDAVDRAVASRAAVAKGASDGRLRTYRLAVAATGEYTVFFGGTKAGALAAITTAINRVNDVYENDLGIRLQLIANNDDIIYTNPAADPYANDGSTDLDTNRTNVNAVIGAANYDVGHLFGTGSGGVAYLGVVCNDSFKAGGLTGLNSPVGDVFYIDFVAHELGHQFGANHTFNGTASNCVAPNRNASTAYEPGSGSTIMAYAGICGSQNLQSNSDPYFHAGSIAEITAFVSGSGGSCAVLSTPVNSVPDVSAGPDVTIPANTPFVLTGSATDVDAGDTLTYVWEQLDAGASSSNPATMVDNGDRALFRSFTPSSSPERYFPRLTDVVAGSSTILGEAYPTTNRTLNFRLTARDNSGGTAFENKVVTTTTSAGPFTVTAPITGAAWTAGVATVSWNVAGTASAPVSCSAVDILFSSNNGVGFPTTLLANTPNDGSQLVTVPNINTTQARIMVMCSDNVFFAVNNGAFQVSNASSPSITSIDDVSVEEGDNLVFTVTLSATTTSATLFAYSLTDVSTNNADYGTASFSNGVTEAGGTLTVPSGVSAFTVTIGSTEDTDAEGNETFTITIGGRTGTGTIQNDDAASSSSSGGGGGGGGQVGVLLMAMLMLIAFYRRRISSDSD